jgi:integrase/recombinase XerD
VEGAQNLSAWLNHHPLKNDINAPLFVTIKLIGKPPAHIRLAEHGIAAVIQKTAKNAGITKHIYPHLLRHSRATHLAAKGLNEPTLRNIFGWKKASTTPSLYIHLSGVNTDDAILKVHGLSNNKDEQTYEMDKCPRCKTVVKKNDSRCYKCNFALNAEAEQIDIILKDALINYFTQCHEDHGELMKTLLAPKTQK